MFKGTYYNVTEQINAGRSNAHILQSLINRNDLYSSTIAAEVVENGFYGYIRGEHLSGDDWIPDSSFDPTMRPWFVDAVAAKDKPVIATPYIDARTGKLVTGVSQSVFDNTGKFMGVLSIDASLSKMFNYIKAFQLKNEGYIILINQNREVLTHVDSTLIGKDYVKVNPRLIPYFEALDSGVDAIIAAKVINSANERAIFSMKKTRSGWYLITAVTENTYYFLVYEVAVALIVIGLLGFLFTAYVLCRFNKQRQTAVDANLGKTAFLARMSHELRTPLNAINGFAEIESRKGHFSKAAPIHKREHKGKHYGDQNK
jgi:hypothetical protein